MKLAATEEPSQISERISQFGATLFALGMMKGVIATFLEENAELVPRLFPQHRLTPICGFEETSGWLSVGGGDDCGVGCVSHEVSSPRARFSAPGAIEGQDSDVRLNLPLRLHRWAPWRGMGQDALLLTARAR